MLDASAPQRICRPHQQFRHIICCRSSTAFSTCRRSRPAISRSRRNPLRRPQVVAGCCGLLALRASEAGVQLEKLAGRRSAGNDRRQARGQPDPAQPRCPTRSASPIAAARSRSARAPKRRTSLLPSRTTASASAKRIWRASASRISRPARPTTAATPAPGLAFPSSRDWCGCTAASLSIRSRVGEGTRVTVRLPLDCERARPAKGSPRREPSA